MNTVSYIVLSLLLCPISAFARNNSRIRRVFSRGIDSNSNSSLSSNSSIAEGVPENDDYFEDVESRNCYYALDGTLDGIPFDEPEQYVDCEDGVSWCQKISAHYISFSTITKITMRGCDALSIPDHPDLFQPIACQKEGCREVKSDFDHEVYHVCCCKQDFCNSSSVFGVPIFLLVITSIWI